MKGAAGVGGGMDGGGWIPKGQAELFWEEERVVCTPQGEREMEED